MKIVCHMVWNLIWGMWCSYCLTLFQLGKDNFCHHENLSGQGCGSSFKYVMFRWYHWPTHFSPLDNEKSNNKSDQNILILPRNKLCSVIKETNLNYIFCLIKSSEIVFIFLPAFYLIIWLMTSPKNFEKIAILKIWQLFFF